MIAIPVNAQIPITGDKIYRSSIELKLFPDNPAFFFLTENGEWKEINYNSHFEKDLNCLDTKWRKINTNMIGVEFPLNERFNGIELLFQINEIDTLYDSN